jgi:sugar/nucleoside kinase (ribokinase family)
LWDTPKEARERIEETMALVDVVKVNEVELALLTGVRIAEGATGADAPQVGWPGHHRAALIQGGESLLAMGPRLCVITLGRRGSFFQMEPGYGYAPGFEVPTVDATGCGDAFVAGLLCQLIGRGIWREGLTVASVRAALRYANAVGALTSLTRGVIPALPTAAQVESFLFRRGPTAESAPGSI